MRYEHAVRITRPAGGAHADSGAFVPGAPLVLYDGEADFQDVAGKRIAHNVDGRPVPVARDRLFLEDESGITLIETGDVVTLTRFGPDGQPAETLTRVVDAVVWIDGSIALRPT